MNQILYTDKTKDSKLSIETTLKIFAAALIVFGLISAISGGYAIYQEMKKPKEPEIEWPVVTMTQEENILKLSVGNNVAIDKIVYNWNGQNQRTIFGKGNRQINTDIQIPVGTNVFNITITDIAGNKKDFVNVYTAEEIVDTSKPIIDLVVTGSKLNITAKTANNAKLSYLTYRWNNEEETKIEATGELKTIETRIDILKGTNTLTVIAVDENNNTQTQTKEFKGVTKPVITVERSGANLLIKITHETAVKSADIVFNEKNIVLTESWFGGKEVEISLALRKGNNRLTITAYSADDTTETFDGTTEF